MQDECTQLLFPISVNNPPFCFIIENARKNLARFPEIYFRFHELAVSLTPTEYFAELNDTFCLGFRSATYFFRLVDKKRINQIILGMTFMLHKQVFFDLDKHQLGLISSKCEKPNQFLLPSHIFRTNDKYNFEEPQGRRFVGLYIGIGIAVLVIIAALIWLSIKMFKRRQRNIQNQQRNLHPNQDLNQRPVGIPVAQVISIGN